MNRIGCHTFSDTGAGDPVVCLHGIGGDDRSFAEMGSNLSDRFRVIAWNMPGYRGAERQSPFSFAALSDSLTDFLQLMELGSATLVGHSIGGMLAMEQALRDPQTVNRLVLIGTTPAFGGRDDSFKDAFLKDRLAPLDAGQTMAEMAVEAAPYLTGPTAGPDTHALVAQTLADTPEPVWRDILACLVTFNRRDDLDRITQPTLLLSGGHDRNAPPKTMEKMATKLSDARYKTLPEAGHMIQMEFPGPTSDLILEFLTEKKP